MMEKELGKWTKLLCVCCCVLVVGSRAVRQGHEVNYKGCQILTDECLHDDDCDYHDLHQRCGQYFARHRIKDTDDALPPISLAEMWPFFPRHALGPVKNRKTDAYFRHQRSPAEEDTEFEADENQREDGEESPSYDDDKVLNEDQPMQPVTRQNQRKLYRSLGELRSPHLEANTGQYSETKPLHNLRDINRPESRRSLTGSLTDSVNENFGTRPSRRDVESNRKFETRSVQSEVKTNGQYDHPAGDSHLRNQIYEIYTRLSRLADLNNADDWTGKNRADGGYKDYKIPSRIKNNDHKSHRGLSEPDHVDKILLNEKEVADKQLQDGVKVDSKKIIDYLNFHQSHLAERARPSDTQYLGSPAADQPGLKVDVDKKSDKTQTLEDSKYTERSSPRLEVPKRSSEETSGTPKSANFYPAKNDEKSATISKNQQTESSDDVGTLILQTANRIDPKTLNTIGGKLQKVLWDIDPSERKIFDKVSINKNINLHMNVPSNLYSSEFDPHIISKRINTDASLRKNISGAIGFTVIGAQSKKPGAVTSYPISLPKDKNWDEFAIIIAVVGGCTLGLIVASLIICSLKRRGHHKNPIEFHKKEAKSDYEELCRTKMAVNAATSPRSLKAVKADRQRHGLVDNNGKITSKSWREEPLAYNMDITTGHVILSYMEDHLNDENKLSSEWEALCNYKADQDETTVSEESKNVNKNRYSNVLPYDHTRVKLRETANVFHSDYINASYITDADPRNPAYIATQGPLDNTVADFWQMIWEQGVVVIVNLTRLSDMGLPQCHRYWPEEGSDVYNTYQVHLISEHIWCDDYIVRSFYLKHLMTSETRTVTQFHFLTWPDLSVPESAKPILEFRRKVNKCYRGHACPIVVHCNNGVGRTGTYILIDMVLKKMIKGTKEIDIAATLEHLRDQRPDMVKTKAQFEFTLAAVAEEVTAILSSLSS